MIIIPQGNVIIWKYSFSYKTISESVRGKFYKAFGIGSARCGITLLPSTYKNGTTKTSKELEAQLQELKSNVLMSTMVVLVDPRAMTSDIAPQGVSHVSASMADIHDAYVDLHVVWMRLDKDNSNQVLFNSI